MNDPQNLTFKVGGLSLMINGYQPGQTAQLLLATEMAGENQALTLAQGRIRFGQGHPEHDQNHAANLVAFGINFRTDKCIFNGDWPFDGSYLQVGDMVMGPIKDLRVAPVAANQTTNAAAA